MSYSANKPEVLRRRDEVQTYVNLIRGALRHVSELLPDHGSELDGAVWRVEAKLDTVEARYGARLPEEQSHELP